MTGSKTNSELPRSWDECESALPPKADTCSAILGRVIPIKLPISLNPTASMRRAFSKGWPIP